MSAFGGARGVGARAPEKGVFPLDHFHECATLAKQYLECLKSEDGQADACREISKKYLLCRMDKNLMADQDLTELGFKEGSGPQLK
jgi:cytochrome c oxidase assembly protein subunit 19